MAKWPKKEIENAITEFIKISSETWASGDIEAWAQWYTEDVVFSDLGGGYGKGIWQIEGRKAVLEFYKKLNSTYPTSHLIHYPSPWFVVDEERGWVVMEWTNRMADPGDGSIHEEKCYSRLHYAGNNQFSFEEDVYNPDRMTAMVQGWVKVHQACLAKATDSK